MENKYIVYLKEVATKLGKGGKIEKSMRAFIDAYSPKRAFIISYNEINDEMKVNGCKIFFVGIHKIKEILSKPE